MPDTTWAVVDCDLVAGSHDEPRRMSLLDWIVVSGQETEVPTPSGVSASTFRTKFGCGNPDVSHATSRACE